MRIVRQELATHFDLEQDDVLNSGKYKSFIKDTVHATVVRDTRSLLSLRGRDE